MSAALCDHSHQEDTGVPAAGHRDGGGAGRGVAALPSELLAAAQSIRRLNTANKTGVCVGSADKAMDVDDTMDASQYLDYLSDTRSAACLSRPLRCLTEFRSVVALPVADHHSMAAMATTTKVAAARGRPGTAPSQTVALAVGIWAAATATGLGRRTTSSRSGAPFPCGRIKWNGRCQRRGGIPVFFCRRLPPTAMAAVGKQQRYARIMAASQNSSSSHGSRSRHCSLITNSTRHSCDSSRRYSNSTRRRRCSCARCHSRLRT